MSWLGRILISSLSVMLLAWLLPGITVNGYLAAVLVAIVLSFLNGIVKPILIVLTIPVTIVSLGLFLLVINAGMVMLADRMLDSFTVRGFWWALLFSFLLSIVNSILIKPTQKRENHS